MYINYRKLAEVRETVSSYTEYSLCGYVIHSEYGEFMFKLVVLIGLILKHTDERVHSPGTVKDTDSGP